MWPLWYLKGTQKGSHKSIKAQDDVIKYEFNQCDDKAIWSSTFATQTFSRLFKCEQCDHEESQKHLLSTHKRVGTKFKCNQCDRVACQWCSLKSHKQRKYIKYQCDHCHYKPSKKVTLQNKRSPAQLKGLKTISQYLKEFEKSTFLFTCQSHIT